ncbi:ABC transporter permease [Chitinophaga agrisoli]|uniref:ABC transporter permease n=1 Tax=Chitinophaga agrisoli TaxID=2607653 RepID=UPI001BC97E4E|nr:ABC transporter permease [Chitinophaga agrisoli]
MNSAGLLIGFSAFLLIFLVLTYERSFDGFHAKKDRIYRVVREGKKGGHSATASFPLANSLKAEFPQVESAASIYGDRNVQVIIPGPGGETWRKFREPRGVFFADQQFFNIFDGRIIAGNPATAIVEPNTALLTKRMATKYFGDWKEAMGKVLKVYDLPIRITGILDDLPVNTDFPLGVVISHKTVTALNVDMQDWVELWTDNYCFVLLRPGAIASRFNEQLPAFLSRHVSPDNADYNLMLQPLADIHFDKRFANFNHRTFSYELIKALSLIGIFLLVIACVNFINLSTANAVSRAREVGVRKVLGSNRQQLLLQFFGETGLTALMAIIGALMVALCCMPFLNSMLESHLSAGMLFSPRVIQYALGAWLGVTLLAGSYPALVLSGFNPVNALKSRMAATAGKGVSVRRGLVVLQFVIAQVLIIATLVVSSQLNYFNNADMGFNKEAVVSAGFPRDSLSQAKLNMFRSLLLQQPGIQAVSFSAFAPVGEGSWATDLKLSTNHTSKADLIVHMKPADTGYFDMYKLQLLAGRIYSPSDTVKEYIVNERLLKVLNLGTPDEAIGKNITVNGDAYTYPIVGVVKDFHMSSLRDPLSAIVMTTLKRTYRTANIKITPGKTREALASMAAAWNKVFPDYVFEYRFIDQTVADYYKQENQLARLFRIFAGLAIFISCLGLYGLVSFMAARRKKEIGIRKVLGAPVSSILLLLSREFTVLIAVAFLLAAPLAWYFMQDWLEQYTFRISLGIGFFITTLLFCIGIAWLTVGHATIKVAVANPVKSLRTE